jgi:putative membrane protein
MPHNPEMHPIAIAAAALAALIHVYFFVLESLWFTRPNVYRRFGLASGEEAETVRSFAYNQGWYNLFLAIGVAVGVALAALGDQASGRAITLFSCGSMIAAGLVLVAHDPSFLRAAMIQALPPVVAVLAVVFLG